VSMESRFQPILELARSLTETKQEFSSFSLKFTKALLTFVMNIRIKSLPRPFLTGILEQIAIRADGGYFGIHVPPFDGSIEIRVESLHGCGYSTRHWEGGRIMDHSAEASRHRTIYPGFQNNIRSHWKYSPSTGTPNFGRIESCQRVGSNIGVSRRKASRRKNHTSCLSFAIFCSILSGKRFHSHLESRGFILPVGDHCLLIWKVQLVDFQEEDAGQSQKWSNV
jgi:hypothetical protein